MNPEGKTLTIPVDPERPEESISEAIDELLRPVGIGSNPRTVQQDRETLRNADAVCCDLEDLIRLDPREPYWEDDYSEPEPIEPEVECFYCGSRTRSPFWYGARAFCTKSCGDAYAE
jgi:hypothetical protein